MKTWASKGKSKDARSKSSNRWSKPATRFSPCPLKSASFLHQIHVSLSSDLRFCCDSSSKAQYCASSSESSPSETIPATKLGSESQVKYVKAKDEDDGLDEEDEEEHGDTLCGACGENYASDEFWICCDICERWFHGKCVKITPARAEHIKQYKCPSCSGNKRARP
ncbi:hypothetical protein TEA_005481 [Camellia sinensis var. sinensis]|uniref:PHD finger protein ALFIN-LIKE n=1 Tax=Camellia sinensis var. sinensis TaxID=542762 RepID=A0A4S4EFD4_CAMSN|nr:hypothetical protein TEA_005481 [Camellia sinensis var. sinensis]